MSPVSRGFRHLHRASDEEAGRVLPGQYVARCRTCGSVLMVLVRRTDAIGVDLSGLADLSQPGSA